MSSLENEMERIGKLLAFDRNLIVQVRGSKAYSVPGRVVIPNAEEYRHLGINAERMLHGLLDHECGHAKWTKHEIMDRAIKFAGQPFGWLVNAVEDGRIERLMGAEFIGSFQNLHRKNRWFWEDERWMKSFKTEEPWPAFTRALTLVLRNSVKLDEVRAARPEIADLIDIVMDKLDGRNFDRVVKSCDDAYTYALRIWNHFMTKMPPPPPPPPSPGDDEEEKGDEDSDDGDGAGGDGEGEEPEPSSGSSEPSDEESADDTDEDGEPVPGSTSEPEEGDPEDGEDDEAEGDSSGADEGGEDEAPTASDPTDGADGDETDEGEDEEGAEGIVDPYRALRGKDLRKSEAKDCVDPEEAVSKLMASYEDSDKVYRVFSHEFDVEIDLARTPSAPTIGHDPMLIERQAHDAVAPLVQAFETVLRARSQHRPVGGADEGEVDPELLMEFSVGSAPADTIYRQFVADDDRKVAVGIMLDCSGSMRGGRRDTTAAPVAHAMSLALSQCQIAHEITGFTTTISGHHGGHPWVVHPDVRRDADTKLREMRYAMIEAQKHGVDPLCFAREVIYGDAGDLENAPLQVPTYAIFKSYDSPDLQGLRWAVGSMENLDGEAVMWQARRLARRPESRRVMFVLSDGMPVGAIDDHLGAMYLKESVRRIIAAGIEVYAIGIQTTAPRHFYPHCAVVNDLDSLMSVALTSLVEVISQGRQEIECVGAF